MSVAQVVVLVAIVAVVVGVAVYMLSSRSSSPTTPVADTGGGNTIDGAALGSGLGSALGGLIGLGIQEATRSHSDNEGDAASEAS